MTSATLASEFVFVLTIGELCWRLGRCLREYIYFPIHYPADRMLRTIFARGFQFSKRCIFMFIILLAWSCIQYQHAGKRLEDIAGLWHLVPIWWVIRFTQLTQCMLDYSDSIRLDSGLDYATGMASNYFHGYLNIVLPEISKRIEDYETRHNVTFAIQKLVVLIPNSLHTRPIIKSPLMERQDGQPLSAVIKNRAGVSRPYTNDVYRLLIDSKPYYITVEGATPLLSYFDAFNFDLTTTKEMKLMQKEILIKFYRYLKNLLEKWPDTQEQCELVFYNDYTANGKQQDVGEVLCTHIKNIWEKNAYDDTQQD